jgi:hypothetical protein
MLFYHLTPMYLRTFEYVFSWIPNDFTSGPIKGAFTFYCIDKTVLIIDF